MFGEGGRTLVTVNLVFVVVSVSKFVIEGSASTTVVLELFEATFLVVVVVVVVFVVVSVTMAEGTGAKSELVGGSLLIVFSTAEVVFARLVLVEFLSVGNMASPVTPSATIGTIVKPDNGSVEFASCACDWSSIPKVTSSVDVVSGPVVVAEMAAVLVGVVAVDVS